MFETREWEYIIEPLNLVKWNALGEDGWELVTVTEVFDGDGVEMKSWGYFKRRTK